MSEGYPVTRLNDGLYIHRREERLISRVIDGEAIIVDFKTGDHYSLNSIGTLVWEMADGVHSLKDIVASIIERYDISEVQARADPVSYTHLRAHETVLDLVCRLLLEKKKINNFFLNF